MIRKQEITFGNMLKLLTWSLNVVLSRGTHFVVSKFENVRLHLVRCFCTHQIPSVVTKVSTLEGSSVSLNI